MVRHGRVVAGKLGDVIVKKSILNVIVIALALCLGAAALAEQNGTSIGVLAGWANLNNGGGSPGTWGVDLGLHKGIFIMPGLTYNTLTPNSSNISGTNYSQGLSNLYFHAELMLGDLGAGALAGINWWNNNAPGASNNTNFIYGLLAHWDWSLGKSFSIGPRVDFIWNSGNGAYNETDLIGVLKFWF